MKYTKKKNNKNPKNKTKKHHLMYILIKIQEIQYI